MARFRAGKGQKHESRLGGAASGSASMRDAGAAGSIPAVPKSRGKCCAGNRLLSDHDARLAPGPPKINAFPGSERKGTDPRSPPFTPIPPPFQPPSSQPPRRSHIPSHAICGAKGTTHHPAFLARSCGCQTFAPAIGLVCALRLSIGASYEHAQSGLPAGLPKRHRLSTSPPIG